jgi:hypothetical protein
MPVAPTPAAEAKSAEAKSAEVKPAEVKAPEDEDGDSGEQTQPMPVAQTKPAEETAPVEPQKPAGAEPKARQAEGEKAVAPKEQVGSQYRERMEDPEDTGEFYLAFESPVIKPA